MVGRCDGRMTGNEEGRMASSGEGRKGKTLASHHVRSGSRRISTALTPFFCAPPFSAARYRSLLLPSFLSSSLFLPDFAILYRCLPFFFTAACQSSFAATCYPSFLLDIVVAILRHLSASFPMRRR